MHPILRPVDYFLLEDRRSLPHHSSHMSEQTPAWPHAPTHQLSEAGTYLVTSGTYLKEHFFRGQKRLGVLQRGLLKFAAEFGWRLEAWAVFSNHYHFIAHSPEEGAKSLETLLRTFHTDTARWINRLDNSINRQVWHNYWETRLTYPNSYLARLNYVHQNAVKHGLVPVASAYPWCSAAWFERTATPAQVRSIYRFKVDQVRVLDGYEVDPNW